jgi:hypothetical protein
MCNHPCPALPARLFGVFETRSGNQKTWLWLSVPFRSIKWTARELRSNVQVQAPCLLLSETASGQVSALDKQGERKRENETTARGRHDTRRHNGGQSGMATSMLGVILKLSVPFG